MSKMASNKSVNSNDALHANVRVKIEPGTSVSPTPSTSSSSSSLSVPLSERVSIKVEPGLPTTATQRLVSYRLPRDLTLGGNIKIEKPKKVYIPNLNVQRNKKKEQFDFRDPAVSIKAEPVKSRHNNRVKEREKGDRGRGKGDKGNIIQSIGVWSEGIYTPPKKYEGSRERASSSTANFEKHLKPKLNKIAKTKEENKLNNLSSDELSDDYPDDEKMYPLTLPRIKKEMYNTIDDKIDKKSIILENAIIKGKETKQYTHMQENLSISKIIENNSYTLIQFPGSLPGLKYSREEAGSKQSNDSNTHDNKESDNKEKLERCILNDLKSGLLGKLEILKSGKARLRLGEMSFFVDIGTHQDFQQDLLAVKIDAASQTGDLINLGPVNSKLICSPDFESMLENS
ncbi:DNA-directed RNA polymerase III subunit RPC4 isoform X1 [Solenopsis invicta]|uniref:DNA-directed RNA polymerase III subunit RPC4 isoform X1 n=1 Tax=Solenopsis invicta TaxID=13686 RepID=UPI000E33EDD1|nr:DNA-directed RNA polymerase III subunit RPC4 isoform X1 [Solenopsis invicta]